MKLLRRPSFYFFVVPFLGIAAGSLLHEAMGCEYECTGSISGPLDRVAMFVAYLFGYGLPLFLCLAAFVLALELAYFKLVARNRTKSSDLTVSPPSGEQTTKP